MYLESAPQAAFEDADLPRPILDQRNQTFVPWVLAIPVGTTVDFPNSDSTFHNVFSLSKARRFDLGRYPKGATRSVRFDRPGVVRVFCEIHSHMNAYVLVFAHRYFATTDEAGRYRIANVPPGDYRLVLWHDGREREARPVHVARGGRGRGRLRGEMNDGEGSPLVAAQPGVPGQHRGVGAGPGLRPPVRHRPRDEERRGPAPQALDDSALLVGRSYASRLESLTTTARLIADLPLLKALVATGDADTVRPVARDYAAQIKAPLLAFANRDGQRPGRGGHRRPTRGSTRPRCAMRCGAARSSASGRGLRASCSS